MSFPLGYMYYSVRLLLPQGVRIVRPLIGPFVQSEEDLCGRLSRGKGAARVLDRGNLSPRSLDFLLIPSVIRSSLPRSL